MNTLKPVTFALVLKTGGGVYDYKYVNNIIDGIRTNCSLPHKIVVLTDDKRGITTENVELLRFKHDWPKWWGKIELFRPDLFDEDEQVIFLDLDTFIVGNLDEVASYRGEFCALRDFYNLDVMASGVMSWHGPRVVRIYEEFVSKADHFMRVHEVAGDQAFIRAWKPSIEYFQDLYPNQVISYKVHCRGKAIPNDARILCFHGTPKPHEVRDDTKVYWKQ